MLRSVASFLGLPFLSRALGLLVLAGAFAGVVYDGARSIANNGLRVTSVGDLAALVLKDRLGSVQGAAEGAAPWLWHALGLPLTLAPAALVGLVLGTLLLWLGQPGREPVGFLTRP